MTLEKLGIICNEISDKIKLILTALFYVGSAATICLLLLDRFPQFSENKLFGIMCGLVAGALALMLTLMLSKPGLSYALIRNQIFLKPLARPALSAMRNAIKSKGFKPKEMYLSLGLAEANMLHTIVIFHTDMELSRFNEQGFNETAIKTFQDSLLKSFYPKVIFYDSPVSFHSQEAINRAGGWYFYFH